MTVVRKIIPILKQASCYDNNQASYMLSTLYSGGVGITPDRYKVRLKTASSNVHGHTEVVTDSLKPKKKKLACYQRICFCEEKNNSSLYVDVKMAYAIMIVLHGGQIAHFHCTLKSYTYTSTNSTVILKTV